MQFRYRLIDERGEDLGPLVTSRSYWTPGDRLSRWHGERLSIVRVIPAEPDELFSAYLVVRKQADSPGQSRRQA